MHVLTKFLNLKPCEILGMERNYISHISIRQVQKCKFEKYKQLRNPHLGANKNLKTMSNVFTITLGKTGRNSIGLETQG